MNMTVIRCPVCQQRIMDINRVEYDGLVITTKCHRCRTVLAVTIKNKKVSTEQIAARTK